MNTTLSSLKSTLMIKELLFSVHTEKLYTRVGAVNYIFIMRNNFFTNLQF